MSPTVSGDPDHATTAPARPAPRRYACLPAADRVIAPLVTAAAHRLATRTPQPLAVVLQGSCALGEACGYREADGSVTILSDLDLAVIVRDPGERDAWRAHARTWAAEAASLPGSDRVLADWSLGVYAVEDLPRQAAKMGTLELARRALVLEGAPQALASVVRHAAAAISEEEVLRLLAVRATELLAARAEWAAARGAGEAPFGVETPAGRAGRRLANAALKLLEDLGTALLSSVGGYVVGACRRDGALQTAWRAEPALSALAARDPWLPAVISAAGHARHTGLSWADAAHAVGVGRAPFPDLVDRLDEATARPFTAATSWLFARNAGPADGASAATLAGAITSALGTASAHPTTRTWLRLARHAGDMPARIEILRLAAHHRFGPPPWLVGAALAALAVPGSARGDRFGVLKADAEAVLGRTVTSPDALRAAALRTWALLA